MTETPDQKINAGICVVGAVLGGWTQIFLQAISVLRQGALWDLAGMAIGLIIGTMISTLRPRIGHEGRIWKRIDQFFLTQMDLASAFKRRKK